MKLTIIETGLPPGPLRESWPDYPTMFNDLLKPHCSSLMVETVALHAGAPLRDPEQSEAILITGSACGVYDDLPWINELIDFIIRTAEARIPQAGICFGHQAMAKAFGARVEKSEKGWGLGRHSYEVVHKPAWMTPEPTTQFALGVSHQDQVLSCPQGAVVFATSHFTQFAGLDYPDINAISLQGHPEFSPDFCRALYETRRGSRLSDDEIAAASRSLDQPVDNHLVGGWMVRVLTHSSI